MGRGVKLDIDFAHIEEGWEADNKEAGTLQESKSLSPHAHRLTIRMEKRKGKPVTVVGSFAIDKKSQKKLLTTLKRRLGRGGTFKQDCLEIQGECQEVLKKSLIEEGYRFKT